MQAGSILGAKTDLVVRMAADAADIDAAQHLRYRVFYEELSARPDELARRTRRDSDAFDDICDHLLVVSPNHPDLTDPITVSDGTLVGTYRLLRQSVAEMHRGFYTQDEFNIAPLITARPELQFLELGRSCVLKPYRTRPVVELLWQGIWNYVRFHELDVMLGCASLEGTDPQAHALPLSFMAHFCAAPPAWRVRAQESRYVEMNLLPREAVDPKAALRLLPPLIKGYLRLGCYIGEGAVIDPQFNTVDVLIVLPVSAINSRYFTHFEARENEGLPQRLMS